MKVNPYLNFDGTAEQALNFYKQVFGGEFQTVMRFSDMPQGEHPIADEEKNRIMHMALPLGDSMLMASDTSPSMGHVLIEGNNNYVSLAPDSLEETQRIFDELSKGGEVEMPLQLMFWGDYFASFTDKFGVKWMLSFHEDKN